MRWLAPALVVFVLVALPATAQFAVRPAPAPAARFELPRGSDAALPLARAHLTPQGAQWVAMETQRVRSGAIAPSQVSLDAAGVKGALTAGADMEELAFIVLMQAAEAQDQDLRQIMAETKAINNRNAAVRQQAAQLAAADQNAVTTQSDMNLQKAMNQRSQVAQALSNIMKKMNDSNDSIVKNMK